MMSILNNSSLIYMFFLFYIGLMVFFLNSKHLLSLLLSLEVVMMSLYCLSSVCICYLNSEIFYSLIILTFAACEAAVGLSVLVNMINSHGTNYVNSMNLNQC